MNLNATVLLPDGSVESMPLHLADKFHNSQLQLAIVDGVQIGAAIILSAILCMAARTYKSILFVLYQTNLALLILHSVLNIQNLESSIWSMSWYLTGITEASDTTINCTIAYSILYWFLIISICATLVVQVHASFCDLSKRNQNLILLASCVAVFPCIFVWGYFLITNASIASQAKYTEDVSYDQAEWAIDGSWPVFTTTTTVFSAILCIKLFFVLRSRARMGIVHFDPLKAVFTMTLQNSVCPAVLNIVTASLPDDKTPNSLPAISIAMTVLFLPIGYVWAQYRSGDLPAGSPGPTSSLAAYLARARSLRSHDLDSTYEQASTPTTSSSRTFEKKIDYIHHHQV